MSLDQEALRYFREMLERALDGLHETVQGQFSCPEGQPAPDGPMDEADKADLEHHREVLRHIENRNRRLAWQIHRALERIEKGEFGICESCGDPISYKRLMVQPTAVLCLSCQREIERAEKASGRRASRAESWATIPGGIEISDPWRYSMSGDVQIPRRPL